MRRAPFPDDASFDARPSYGDAIPEPHRTVLPDRVPHPPMPSTAPPPEPVRWDPRDPLRLIDRHPRAVPSSGPPPFAAGTGWDAFETCEGITNPDHRAECTRWKRRYPSSSSRRPPPASASASATAGWQRGSYPPRYGDTHSDSSSVTDASSSVGSSVADGSDRSDDSVDDDDGWLNDFKYPCRSFQQPEMVERCNRFRAKRGLSVDGTTPNVYTVSSSQWKNWH